MAEPRQTVATQTLNQSMLDRASSGNIFTRAAAAQSAFSNAMRENGYNTFTTFYSDLTLAEPFGERGIRGTDRDVTRSWGNNVKYWTEYAMSLNHKIWEHYDRGNMALSELYDSLWRKANTHAYRTFKGNDLRYYIRTTD